MLTNLLIIDIETVPQVADFSLLNDTWKKLWLEKISKTVPENVTPEIAYQQRAGIMAEFGKIICISTAFFYEDEHKNRCLKIKSIYGHDEKAILSNFTSLCNKMQHHFPHFQFAGHNIKEFDIPFVGRRFLINHLPLPNYMQLQDTRPWDVKMFDTLSWWKFGDYKNYTSLNLLAHVLDIPTSKSDIDGSMVQQVYYQEKNLQRIVNYCQKDVVVTANIILRFHNKPILQEQQITIVE
ncbi:MAG: ribonuclease H-like domain-containing protein [Chitinophagaceae bacterium]